MRRKRRKRRGRRRRNIVGRDRINRGKEKVAEVRKEKGRQSGTERRYWSVGERRTIMVQMLIRA